MIQLRPEFSGSKGPVGARPVDQLDHFVSTGQSVHEDPIYGAPTGNHTGHLDLIVVESIKERATGIAVGFSSSAICFANSCLSRSFATRSDRQLGFQLTFLAVAECLAELISMNAKLKNACWLIPNGLPFLANPR